LAPTVFRHNPKYLPLPWLVYVCVCVCVREREREKGSLSRRAFVLACLALYKDRERVRERVREKVGGRERKKS